MSLGVRHQVTLTPMCFFFQCVSIYTKKIKGYYSSVTVILHTYFYSVCKGFEHVVRCEHLIQHTHKPTTFPLPALLRREPGASAMWKSREKLCLGIQR